MSFLALAIGLTAAFAFNTPQSKPAFSQIWQEVNSSGQLVIDGAYFEVANSAAAADAFDCHASTTPCAGLVDQVNGTLQGPMIYKP